VVVLAVLHQAVVVAVLVGYVAQVAQLHHFLPHQSQFLPHQSQFLQLELDDVVLAIVYGP
jgi:hypothetical protein